ncbi:hypothetical protein [Nostoc sp. CHAB 5715]|nr:hypothetical protein [Nostoc sp. CHAB 5715]MCC5621077.1 hypothetical protein [Nostoc sp. CHAB 5715]
MLPTSIASTFLTLEVRSLGATYSIASPIDLPKIGESLVDVGYWSDELGW